MDIWSNLIYLCSYQRLGRSSRYVEHAKNQKRALTADEGWTLRGAIQSHIDVYASESTYREVGRAFPYLVAKEHASGGGDVRKSRISTSALSYIS